ncbi:MAG TPA: penicillin acylase family protein [Actinophytocola sp.]|uniref:penicillin acylase family protein n=1 Tax=Actinophytocola sp. TaxID=1872138 RepID=UPI002DB57569|nr:penicillin acylase family protein [Actinophytocola sp.]HEU5472400.1 penicillin acylase family protein [Actinophytocola sp.]
MRRSLSRAVAVAAAMATVLTTITGAAAAEPADGATELRDARGLAADIRYTEYGIPHIKANDFAGLGYGYGFAAARDNICVLADTYLTVAAERSRFLGPDAPGNTAYGAARTSLSSDLYFRQVNDSGVVERSMTGPPPHGPRAEVRQIVRGYVAGYNRFLRETGAAGITDPACRGAAWVRPIAETDVYRHFYALATLAGQGQVIDGITEAAPPAAGPATAAAPVPPDAAERVAAAIGMQDMGSNAIAIGSAGARNHRGLLLGNPHYPWHGGRRFWQSQLTVPGRLDVSGGSLLGIPLVQIGFNRDVAWSHTVATPATFGLYQLTLASPTTYLVDGRPEQMTSRQVSVQVRNPDGSLSTVQRTLYSTRYGPMLSPVFGLPLNWTATSAFTMRDANAGNMRGLNTWFEFGQARGTRDIVEVLSRTQGVPWVNTIAADQSGRALYADIQVAPHVTDELAARCNTPLGAAIFPATGIPVLDGARGNCAWGSDPDALLPGIFGPRRMPLLTRSDYVANSNDSAWLSNPRQPITGYPRIVGTIGTEREPRTRMGITAIEQQLDRGRFTRQDLQNLLFNDRSFIGEQAAAATAAMCAAFPNGQAPTSAGGTVPVGRACAALSTWDKTMTVGSRGGLLFERYWLRVADAFDGPPAVWRVPFDPADPVRTPHTLDTANPVLHTALGDAVAELRAAGIEPDAPLGRNHYVVRGGRTIPVHGGHGSQGVLNMIIPGWDPARGATEVVHGSSHMQVVSYTGGPCPDAVTLLSYSQSSDPRSAHHADQTELFSASRWVRSRFCEHDIRSAPGLKVVRLRER